LQGTTILKGRISDAIASIRAYQESIANGFKKIETIRAKFDLIVAETNAFIRSLPPDDRTIEDAGIASRNASIEEAFRTLEEARPRFDETNSEASVLIKSVTPLPEDLYKLGGIEASQKLEVMLENFRKITMDMLNAVAFL